MLKFIKAIAIGNFLEGKNFPRALSSPHPTQVSVDVMKTQHYSLGKS